MSKELETFKIEWEVDDGYIGGGKHYTTIYMEDIEDLSPKEIEDFIYAQVEEDMMMVVSSHITDWGIAKDMIKGESNDK